MVSNPVTSWQIAGEGMEIVTDFIFFGFKITAAMKLRHLLLGRKAMTNLHSILKSRDIIVPTKVHLVKVIWFLVFGYMVIFWLYGFSSNHVWM